MNESFSSQSVGRLAEVLLQFPKFCNSDCIKNCKVFMLWKIAVTATAVITGFTRPLALRTGGCQLRLKKRLYLPRL